MDECVREMTFEEEYEILKREANKLFESEIDGCEEPKANCIVRRALRCIDKLTKENKLAKEYRELEEQGRLLKLQCNVGTEVFAIFPIGDHYEKCQIKKIEIRSSVMGKIRYFVEPTAHRGCSFSYFDDEFEKRVFLTKEEAEAKLKEMETSTE